MKTWMGLTVGLRVGLRVGLTVGLTVGLLVCPRTAQANPTPVDYRARYSQCLKAAGQTNNASVITCANQTSEAAKREMARLYQQIYARMAARQPTDAQQFERSHTAWVSYRDRHCQLAGTYIGSPMVAYCPMQLNIARIAELREFLP
jgi:uncharacterized protein YecT (DUF1311 family)